MFSPRRFRKLVVVTPKNQGAAMTEQPDYLAYLLRLWRESGDDENGDATCRGDAKRRLEEPAVWRASLECSKTSERQGFAGLDDLVDFLRRQIGAVSVCGGERDDDEG
jgi:hypothetical protein